MRYLITIQLSIAKLLTIGGLAMVLFTANIAQAQYDYIPNGSFEELTDGEIRYPKDTIYRGNQGWKYCKDWFCPNDKALNYDGSYYSTTPYPSYGPSFIHYNLMTDYRYWDFASGFYAGIQGGCDCNAYSGKGQFQLQQWHIDTLPQYWERLIFLAERKNARSYIAVKLNKPLIKGRIYENSFYIQARTDIWTCATNEGAATIFADDIGVGLSTNAPLQKTTETLNIKQIWRTPVIIDNKCWEKVSFKFIADSNYQYLSIGCFVKSKDIKYKINYPYNSANNVPKYNYATLTALDSISLKESVLIPEITGKTALCGKGNTTLYCNNIGAFTKWYAAGNSIGSGDSIIVNITKDTQIVAGYAGYYDTVNIVLEQIPNLAIKDTFFYTNQQVMVSCPILGYKYQWDNTMVDTFNTKTYTTQGLKYLTIQSINCIYKDTFFVKEINPYFNIESRINTACVGQNILFLTNKNFRAYKWFVGNTNVIISSSAKLAINTKGNYKIIASYDTLNYTFSDTLNIEILDNPKSNLPKIISQCKPLNETICLLFNQPNITYTWSDNTKDSCKQFTFSNTYYLNYTNGYCSSLDTLTVIEKPLPQFKITQLDTPCLDGTNFSVLQIFPDTFSTVQWQPDFISSNQINIFDTVKRIVLVTANNGCQNSLHIKPSNGCNMFFYVPNAFSPNSDGVNDVFNVKGIFIGKLKMSIFNTWGELIFETNELNKGWDGIYQGSICQQGNYLVKITLQSEKTLDGIKPIKYWSGIIQLLR